MELSILIGLAKTIIPEALNLYEVITSTDSTDEEIEAAIAAAKARQVENKAKLEATRARLRAEHQ